MTDILTRLRELAGRATPGGWFQRMPPKGKEHHGSFVQATTATHGKTIMGPTPIQILADDDYPTREQDVEFVAACDPTTILTLLDTIAEANARVAVLVEVCDKVRSAEVGSNPSCLIDTMVELKHAAAAACDDLPAAARALIEERDVLKGERDYLQAHLATKEAELTEREKSLLEANATFVTLRKRAESAEARVAELEAALASGREDLRASSATREVTRERIAALELTQRTKGAVEMCGKCNIHLTDMEDGVIDAINFCPRDACPLRPSPSVTP